MIFLFCVLVLVSACSGWNLVVFACCGGLCFDSLGWILVTLVWVAVLG